VDELQQAIAAARGAGHDLDFRIPVFGAPLVLAPQETAMPASPCIKVCVLDPRTNRCIGCGRSIEEITAHGESAPRH
jgi:hypothetical protein